MQSAVADACAGNTYFCNCIKDPMCPDADFRCAGCPGKARPIIERTVNEVKAEPLNYSQRYNL